MNVSSVITDFSLANVAWLKAPMGSPSIPISEMLAFSYAALQPTRQILDKYMYELDKLEESKKVTLQDLQLLRSSALAQDELVHLTLNVDSALTQETISEILQRVTKEITQERDRELEKELLTIKPWNI